MDQSLATGCKWYLCYLRRISSDGGVTKQKKEPTTSSEKAERERRGALRERCEIGLEISIFEEGQVSPAESRIRHQIPACLITIIE